MADTHHELVTVRAQLLGLVLTCRCGWWDTTHDPPVAREVWRDHVRTPDPATKNGTV